MYLRLVFLSFVFCFSFLVIQGQGKKLPPLSFQANSLTFANTNVVYQHDGGYTQSDTLSDEMILHALAGILSENGQLSIELVGHTAINEPSSLGEERALLIKKRLIEKGIDPGRLSTSNKGNEEPIIDQVVLLGLPTKEEKEAANAKNRRVEVKVVDNTYQSVD